MLQRVSPLLLAAAAALVVVHSSIMLGGMMREAAVAFCAFALLIGAPIAVLAWFGSVTDRGARRRLRRQQLARQKSDAALWQKVLSDAERAAGRPAAGAGLAPRAADGSPRASAVAPRANQQHTHLGRRPERKGNKRRILAHSAAAASVLGLMGCVDTFDTLYADPPAWEVVRPGMGTAELTALVGPPQQIKSNGTIEVWQYCRGGFLSLLDRDAQFDQFGRQPLIKRRADYYVAVWVENEQVREIKPYPVVSRNAGCADFFQAVW